MSVEEMPSTQQVQGLLPDDTGPSWQSRCINGLLRLLPIKKQTASAAAVQEHVRRLALRPARYEPTGLGRGVEVTLKNVAGWPVYYTAPSAKPDIGNYVLFLHGGGYINEIVRAHWRFIGYLTRHARVRCVVPIYPLAPRATAKDVVPATGDLLWKLLEDARPAKVTVVGNSAGAGLGLAAVQWLRDSGYRQPNGLVLISPGVDGSIDRPEHLAVAALALPGRRQCHQPDKRCPGDEDVGVQHGHAEQRCGHVEQREDRVVEQQQAEHAQRHETLALAFE